MVNAKLFAEMDVKLRSVIRRIGTQKVSKENEDSHSVD